MRELLKDHSSLERGENRNRRSLMPKMTFELERSNSVSYPQYLYIGRLLRHDPPPPSAKHPPSEAALPSLTYLHMEIGEGGGLLRWGGKRVRVGFSPSSFFFL